MPGLTGFIDYTENSDQKDSILQNMIQSMKHKDWYSVDRHLSERIAIARIHLGIFNPENQPIFNISNSKYIFFHGEIYDYEDKKRHLEKKGFTFNINNDAEFVLHLYDEKGCDFVNELNGSFVCAIWDNENERLIIANDRYGLRPLYYTNLASQFVFSSEVKPITCFPGFEKKINLKAIPDLLTFGSMLGENTLFEDVFLMPGGSVMIYEKGELTIKKYWDFKYNENYPDKSIDDYCEELNYLYDKAIKKQLNGNHKIGVPLSGGLDSRIVSAYLHKAGCSFSTYTYGVNNCYDHLFAKRVAKTLNTDHHYYQTDGEYIRKYYEDSLKLTNGMLDICDTQQIILEKKIKDNLDVLYIPSEGDVILGGSAISYPIYNNKGGSLIDLIYDIFSIFIRDDMHCHIFKEPIYLKVRNSSRDSLRACLNKIQNNNPVNISDAVYLKNRGSRFIFNANIMPLSGRYEYRIPTYDYDLIDFSLHLPPKFRVNAILLKTLIKNYFPQLAKIPWQKNGVPLTASYVRRRIHNGLRYRFTHKFNGKFARYMPHKDWHDLDRWTRTNNKDFFLEILLDKKTLERPYFNQDYIKKNIIEPHMSGNANLWTYISILTTFELWHRIFFDE